MPGFITRTSKAIVVHPPGMLGLSGRDHHQKHNEDGQLGSDRDDPRKSLHAVFLGLVAFTNEQVMTPSLLVSIRKRINLDVFELLTDNWIILTGMPQRGAGF